MIVIWQLGAAWLLASNCTLTFVLGLSANIDMPTGATTLYEPNNDVGGAERRRTAGSANHDEIETVQFDVIGGMNASYQLVDAEKVPQSSVFLGPLTQRKRWFKSALVALCVTIVAYIVALYKDHWIIGKQMSELSTADGKEGDAAYDGRRKSATLEARGFLTDREIHDREPVQEEGIHKGTEVEVTMENGDGDRSPGREQSGSSTYALPSIDNGPFATQTWDSHRGIEPEYQSTSELDELYADEKSDSSGDLGYYYERIDSKDE